MPRDLDPRMVIDPHGIVDRLKAGESVKLLRQSNIGSADICLKRAAFDMRPGNPRRSGEARCVGTSYHAGLEAYYDERRRRGFGITRDAVLANAREAFDMEAALFDSWATTRDESWQRVVDMLTAYFDQGCNWPETYEVLGVEQEWFLPLSGDWFVKGSIDLVLRQPDEGQVVLADHKTAGRKWAQSKSLPEKQTQAVLYSWAWWMATGEVPDYFAFDVMTYKHEFIRHECHVESRHMQAVLGKAINYTSILSLPPEMLPGNTSSALCSGVYCDYFLICPMGAALIGPSVPVAVGPHGGAS